MIKPGLRQEFADGITTREADIRGQLLQRDVARRCLALEGRRAEELVAVLGHVQDFDRPLRPEDGGEVEDQWDEIGQGATLDDDCSLEWWRWWALLHGIGGRTGGRNGRQAC